MTGKTVKKIIAVVVFVSSLALLFYPFISNYLFENRVDSIISTYREEAAQADTGELDALWDAAERYNKELFHSYAKLTDPFDEPDGELDAGSYSDMLKVGTSDILTYIDIPKINVFLPVYHGTAPETLEKGVGHLEGSSLPVGGEGTHCILSGHTGINRAKIFTDLSEMEEGDLFFLHTLGRTLAYEVDQILVVEPYDVSALQLYAGEDYVTLITCTPYGVNSHRLLVRGRRTEYKPEVINEARREAAKSSSTSSRWMMEYEKALIAGIGIVLVVIVIAAIVQKWRRRYGKHD